MCCHGLSSKKGVACLALRLSFGLSLMFHGATLYKGFGDFQGMVSGGLGPLAPLGMIWAYILPALMIVGGALFVINMYTYYGVWAVGIALGSIPAGMLLKPLLSTSSGGDMMAAANTAFIWLIIYWFVVKCVGCCGCGHGSGAHGENCNCGSCAK